VFGLHRDEVRAFTEKQIQLVATFADQAAIAIENVRLFNETKEALEQQTATAEILRVISQSPTDVQPVFDAIVDSAVRLCDGAWADAYRFDGEWQHFVACSNLPPEGRALLQRLYPRAPDPEAVTGRAILDRAVIHVPDAHHDPRFAITRRVSSTVGGASRSVLAVPMLHLGESVGVILVHRGEQPRPFSSAEIDLLKTFADQAVIAIENVRLFKELEARNRDLTATSEILQVISRSPTDAQPVFTAIARSAAHLTGAVMASVYEFDGTLIHLRVVAPDDWPHVDDLRRNFPTPPARTFAAGRVILDRAILHREDLQNDPDTPELTQALANRMRLRGVLWVPMLRDGEPAGVIGVAREESALFSDEQVRLLQTFADQAVIAIENVRLFTELEARNRDLMATSAILQVISSSPTNVQPVFDAIVDKAAKLGDGLFSTLISFDGELMRLEAAHNWTSEAFDHLSHGILPAPPSRSLPAGRAILGRTVIHLPDIELDQEFRHPELPRAVGFRSVLSVPMLRDSVPLGAISVARAEPGPFSDNQIDLLKTFANQAVIAIENVRLFKELEARTQDLTRSVGELRALGEVGQAISSTLDLGTVLNAIVSRAVQLSGLDGGVVFEYDEAAEEFAQRAMTGTSGTLAEARRTTRIRKGEGVLGRTAITLEPVQVADIVLPGAYEGRLREILIDSGVRAILAVPMVREGQLIGCLAVTRNQPGDFPAETIDLLRTFATQSALAIQNARLFHEIEDKSRQLEAASRHKSEFLANMSHELRTPLNAIIGFSEVLSERMFGELNEKQEEYLKDIYASGQHLLSLINDILDLSKIEAGRMELEVADFSLPAAIDNALILVRERASRRGIKLGSAIDDRVGMIRGDERKVKQVLLNLLSNALKFTPEGGRIDVRATINDGMAEISVADTGVGIAPEDQEAIFEEFRQVGTADKKVEGTGLGLALSRKFIELHGGRIWVKSQSGEGSTFTFTLPVGHAE